MPKRQCVTCGGEYESEQRDGTRYYHACPPVTMLRLRDNAGVERDVERSQVKGTVVATQAEKDALVAKGADPTTISLQVDSWLIARANARDENVTGPPAKPGDPPPIKAPGQGVTAVTK